MKKRAQITLFIILGIIVLAMAAIVFYLRSTTVQQQLSPELIPAISEMPYELRPVRIYTEDCLYTIAEEAFRQLGDKGGYINADFQADSFNPTESEGIQFFQGSGLKIPYWRYLSSDNKCEGNCQFSSLKPKLYREEDSKNSIEAQVDIYVDQTLKECLANYTPFTEQGFSVEETGKLKATTLVGANDVSIFLDYPLSIKKGENSYSVDRFYVQLPLNFKKIYDFASEISESESNSNFLESHVLNLITLLSGTSTGKLPPKAESEFKLGGGTMWSKTKVKQDIESILPIYIGSIQVPFTKTYESKVFPGDDIKTSVYSNDVSVNLDRKYDDLSARFDYLSWWPIYFDLNCNGELCQPESGNNPFFLLLGYQRYDFVYDISFPAMVEINDPSALAGNGYSFRFGLEANIRNNEAINESFPGYNAPVFLTQPLFCNPDSKNSGNVTVVAKDAFKKTGVSSINVMYTCGDHSCFMGETDINGTLVSKFPICYGGIVSFVNYDYFIPAQQLSTKLGKNSLVVSEGYPYLNKDVSVMKVIYDLKTSKLSHNLADLEQDESIIISLEKVPESAGEDKINAVVDFKGNQTGPSTVLRLVPGTYKVSGTMILHRNITIPEEQRTSGSWPFDQDYTIPAISFGDGYMSGGMKMDENTGYIRILPSDLYKSKQIIFYAINPSLPQHAEDMQITQDIDGLSLRFRNVLDPRFER